MAESDSTSVRFRVVGAGLRLLSAVSSEQAGAWAERLFFRAPRPLATPRVRAFLATGERFSVESDGVTLAAWRWGRGPAVYLMHGWGGLGGQLAAFAPPLVAAGYSVVAFDAPGHGDSGGRLSSLPDFARALTAVVAATAPAHAIVAHSLGAAATAIALAEGLRAERVVFLGPAEDPSVYAERFAAAIALPEPAYAAMIRRSEARLRIRWSELKLTRRVTALATPLLVIHDAGDREVAWEEGAAIAAAWPGARLVTTVGLGHRRLLRDPAVVASATRFVRGEVELEAEPSRCSACGAALHGDVHAAGACPAWELERQLFRPAERFGFA